MSNDQLKAELLNDIDSALTGFGSRFLRKVTKDALLATREVINEDDGTIIAKINAKMPPGD